MLNYFKFRVLGGGKITPELQKIILEEVFKNKVCEAFTAFKVYRQY